MCCVFTSKGTNGNDIFHSSPRVSMIQSLRTRFIPKSGDARYSSLLIGEDWLSKQRTRPVTSPPGLLLWAFSWKVPRTHSVLLSFHPTQTCPVKACDACFPLSFGFSTADRHVRGNLSSTGKLTLFSAVSAPCASQPTLVREGQGSFRMSPAPISFLLTPVLARVQAVQFAEIASATS